ncbi:MAG: histone deacetylase family protein [Gammaproteobacteria bacterium]|nr:MAG: deacetylase [Gammaproteobacteria bacterium SG8_31]
MATAYVSHPVFKEHVMSEGHPDSPGRLTSIEDRLQADGIMDFLMYHDAPLATRTQLERAHSARHVETLSAQAPDRGLIRIDPDTYMGPRTLEAAWRAAGAAVLAVDLVMTGQVASAFCAVRPAGHHAERNAAMGFCFFCNTAVAACHAMDRFGLDRVAIVDFDVHHGNGTEDIFRDDPRVLVCSIYQHPLYPYAGNRSVPGHIVNVPVPPGTAGRAWQQAITEKWLPALDEFRPQLVIVSAGFDGHAADPMAELLLTEADYAWVTEQLSSVSERHAGGRLVSCLEGGYDLAALGRCVAIHIRRLAGW